MNINKRSVLCIYMYVSVCILCIYMYVSVCVCMYAWQYLTSGGPIALAKSTVGEKADMANPSSAFVHSFIYS